MSYYELSVIEMPFDLGHFMTVITIVTRYASCLYLVELREDMAAFPFTQQGVLQGTGVWKKPYWSFSL